MTGDQHAGAQTVDVFEHAHDLGRQARVEVTGGFVRQQQGRAVDNGAGDTDALLLAGGQVARVQVGLVRQRHTLQCRIHALDDLSLGQPEDLQRQGNVVEHRTIKQQLMVLEHHTNLTAQERNLRIADGGQVLARQQQLAGSRTLHRQQQA